MIPNVRPPAARQTRGRRKRWLQLRADWSWAGDLINAWHAINALPAALNRAPQARNQMEGTWSVEPGTRAHPCTSTYVGQRGLGSMCPWLEGQEAIPEVAGPRRRAPEGRDRFPPAARSLPQPEPGSPLRVMNAPLCGR